MNVDAELIAKVLDGRATPDERARVLTEADRDPELLGLLADAAVVAGDTGIGNRGPGIGNGRRAIFGIGIAVAAAAGLFFMWPRAREIPAFPESISVSNIIPARDGASILGVRGAADGDRVVQSVIVGSRLTDLRVLGLDTARETAAAEIAHALRSIPGGGVAAAAFEPAGGVTSEMVAAVESVVELRTFRAAEWLELARLAGAAGDWRTLGRADLRAGLEWIASDRSFTTTARELATRIGDRIAAKGESRTIEELSSQALTSLSRR